MAETLIIEVPAGDWLNVSDIVGDNARVTNITEHTLIWRRSILAPSAGDYDGHRVRDTNPFDYDIRTLAPESMWMRGAKFPVRLAITPGIAIGSFRGAIDIHDSCAHRAVYNQFLHFDTATATTLAAPVVSGSNVIQVADATGFAVGHAVKIENGSQEPLFPRIDAIVGTTFTLDTPLTFNHAIGTDVVRVIIDLADTAFAGASVAAPVVFTSHIPVNSIVHVINLSVVMTSTSAMDFTTFGGIAKLPHGIVLRAYSDGHVAHFTNWKQNLDIDADAFPVRYQSKTGGGEFGIAATYNIKEGTEAAVYLDGSKGDRFEVLLQDNISALTLFNMKLQGHYEGL